MQNKLALNVVRSPEAMEQFRKDRFNALLRVSALAAGIGAGATALPQIPKLFETANSLDIPDPADSYVTIGDVQPDPKKRVKLKHELPKLAGLGSLAGVAIGNAASKALPYIQSGAESVGSAVNSGLAGLSDLKDRIGAAITPGEDNAGVYSGLYGPTLATGAAMGGVGLGMYGAHKLIKGIKSRQRDAQLAEAKRKYEKALQEEYESMLLQKHSVDSLYEKRADLASMANSLYANTYGPLVSTITGTPKEEAWRSYLGTMLALTAAGGAGGYVAGRYMTAKKSPEQLKKKILQQRQAQREATPYSAIPFGYTVPVDPSTHVLESLG